MKTAMMVLNYNSYELTRKLTEQVRVINPLTIS
jgi:hypothetical protein